MTEFLQLLTEHYSSDLIAPGLQLAWLADKRQYYCAVHTFPADTIASRKVVAKATENTLDQAVAKCREVWESIILQENMESQGVN